MRLLLLTPEWPPTVGGIGQYISALAPELAAIGAEVTVLGHRILQPSPQERVLPWGRLVSLDYSMPFLWRWQSQFDRRAVLRAALSIREWVARQPYPFDIVEYPNWPGHGALVPGPARRVVRLSTSTAGTSLKLSASERLQVWFERRSVKRAHLVLAHSDAIAAKANETYGRGPDALIPLGLPILPPKDLSRRGDATLNVGILGRAEWRKGTDLVLEALRSAAVGALPDIRLHMVGCRLDEYATPAGLTSLVREVRTRWGDRFVEHGYLSNGELAGIWDRLDWVLMPSRFESFSLVILEAMRAGVPYTMTRTGGWRGFGAASQPLGTLTPGAVDELAVLLRRLPSVPVGVRRQAGEIGRQTFEREFTVARMAERTLSAYHQVLKEST